MAARARDRSRGARVPPAPPASVLAQMRLAHARAVALEAAGIEVAFGPPRGRGGRAIVLRDGAGERPLAPSRLLELVCRGPLCG